MGIKNLKDCYKNLAYSVFSLAIKDLKSKSPFYQKSAEYFLRNIDKTLIFDLMEISDKDLKKLLSTELKPKKRTRFFE